MDVSKGVQIFVLVEKLDVLLSLSVSLVEFILDDALLEVLVSLLQVLIFTEFVSDGSDELFTDLTFLGEIMKVILVLILFFVGIGSAVLLTVITTVLSATLHSRATFASCASRFRARSFRTIWVVGILTRHTFTTVEVHASTLVLESFHGTLLGLATHGVLLCLLIEFLLTSGLSSSFLSLVVFAILGVLNLCSGIREDIHLLAMSEFQMTDVDTFIVRDTVFNFGGITTSSNVDFEVDGVLFVMPDVLERAGEINDELHGVLVELHLGRPSERDRLTSHLGGMNKLSGVETDSL